ncbi:RluA family pseudouridine synthase [Anaerofustis sp.]|uniref:RluA family pseudouridine synthase n=1 Tax=Anaerofustis sp. TaxID=1872517 RepID=UPI0025BDE4DA|nr:RluA family pseudouridine synthase [Anaerofustis sp.]
MKSKMKEITIDKEYMDMRLDRFIGKVTLLSKADIQKLLRKKVIKVNGKKKEGNYRIKQDDVVRFYISDDLFKENDIKKVDISGLDIIFEDENIIILNKKAGILSQGNGSDKRDLASMLVSYLNSSSTGIVTRLDLNTSGIVIGGKNRRSLMLLNEMSRESLIDKRYLTLVKGDFTDEGVITHYGVKDQKGNKLILSKSKVKGAFEVSAFFKIIKKFKGYTLLEVKLITGKTHQIRSQLNTMGYSVVGDRKYNDHREDDSFDKFNLKRQFLHCYKVTLNAKDNFITKDMTFYSKLPKDLDSVINILNHI